MRTVSPATTSWPQTPSAGGRRVVGSSQFLVLGAKARALTSGRYHVSFEDIRALAHPVLRHRIITNFHAQSEGVTTDQIVDRLLDVVPLPRSGM